VGPNIRVIIAFAVDANELTRTIVTGVAWSVARGLSICYEETDVYDVEKENGR
jgi:hypothetical protein